jgi:hypothetical protein
MTALAVVVVAMWVWVSGSAAHAPSPTDKRDFATHLRRDVAPLYGVPVTVESIDAVWGEYSRYDWPLEFFDWHGYQYVAHWRVNGTSARWVEVYPPGTTPDFYASQLDSAAVSAVVAFDSLAKAPMRGLSLGPLDDSGLHAPTGSTVFEVSTFDSKGLVDFRGKDYYLVRRPDGTFALVSADQPPSG